MLVCGTCALRLGRTDDMLMNCTRLEYFMIINIFESSCGLSYLIV